ncbi:3-isopropylmalate dehydratase [Chitinophaga defluvii]|uniref:3-isopropylmalate dehydratase n=1 Tax=Chitinophaga defluvii TaxID=3163343 RepID=A0ABV2TCA2_9BACT
MHVKDLNNNLIEVTDLDKAIEQAGDFKQYQHQDPHCIDTDQQRQRYWADLHQKLSNLKNLKT